MSDAVIVKHRYASTVPIVVKNNEFRNNSLPQSGSEAISVEYTGNLSLDILDHNTSIGKDQMTLPSWRSV